MTPSRISFAVASMLNTTQWTYAPLGASGSSTTSACAPTPGEATDQRSGGVLPWPPSALHANRTGIGAPSRNAGLVTVIESGTLPRTILVWPTRPHPLSDSSPTAARQTGRHNMVIIDSWLPGDDRTPRPAGGLAFGGIRAGGRRMRSWSP